MRVKGWTNDLVCVHDPKSPSAEAYRTLRTNIQFASIDKQLQTLLVTSANAGEGKTTTITNLAVVMAQIKPRVLLMDGDLRKPTLHYRLPISNERGLSNVLIRQATFDEAVQEITEVGLHVITAGTSPPNPAELLNSACMQEVLQQAKARYDMVLIDTPPLLPVTDAQVLARYVDGVLLVISSGTALGEHVKKAKSLLDYVGATVIGTILNRTKHTANNAYYE